MPTVTDDQLAEDEIYIERLLDKKIVGSKISYLVKWLHCGPEDNVWYELDDLQDVLSLI